MILAPFSDLETKLRDKCKIRDKQTLIGKLFLGEEIGAAYSVSYTLDTSNKKSVMLSLRQLLHTD
jgi:hypothetical protein